MQHKENPDDTCRSSLYPRRMNRVLFLGLFLLSFLVVPAQAASKKAEPQRLGIFGSWQAFATSEQKQPVCYMTLTTHFPKNKKFHRGDALLTITHRPAESSTDVVSYTAGYNYKAASSADLSIGKNSFSLFTAQDTAWSRDVVTDHKLAAAIRSASTLKITGTPAQKGIKPQTDTLVLKGAMQAYQAIGKACGIEPHEKPHPAPKAKAKKPKRKAAP